MNKEQNLRKKSAFTLAEVLITLGIIGVVAALTLPSLIENHNKKVWVTALQKQYSIWEQGFQKMKADDGVQNLDDTTAFSSMSGDCRFNSATLSEECQSFLPALKKYFNVNVVTAPDYQEYTLRGSKYGGNDKGRQVLAFSDGTVMTYAYFRKTAESYGHDDAIKAQGGRMLTRQGYLYIDVNGFKKPNTLGRDIFGFDIGGDGKLYPGWGKDESLFDYGNLNRYWRNELDLCGTPGKADYVEQNAYGTGCAARIMENGWKMDY